MRELVLGVAEFLFGVEGTCFPGTSAECEVADLDLERFIDLFAGSGTRLPAVPAPKEFGDEDAWRGEERIYCGSRIHGVRPLKGNEPISRE